MANENFTTYTEVDPDNEVTIISNKVSWDDLQRAANKVLVNKSYGVSHFNADSTHQFEIQYSDKVGNGSSMSWGLTTISGDWDELFADSGNSILCYTGGTGKLGIIIIENGGFSNDETAIVSSGTTHFITIVRTYNGGANSQGQFVKYVRTGSHEGTLIDTLVVDCSAGKQTDYEYLSVCTKDLGPAASQDGFIQNLNLNEAVAAFAVLQEYFQENFQSIGNN